MGEFDRLVKDVTRSTTFPGLDEWRNNRSAPRLLDAPEPWREFAGMRRSVAIIALLLATPATAMEPGWSYSPLPGEGDRATLGCARDSTAGDFACLAVRCEDDFTAGVHIHTSRHPDDLGVWEMTIDREVKSVTAVADQAPYGGRFVEDGEWLLERLRQGTFIYLRHADDAGGAFRFIGLTGSLYAINAALAWCAPRVPPAEPEAAPDVEAQSTKENANGPPPARTQ
jgi:hypothetical protein